MKNLIEYIEEGLLAGQDNTLSTGDKQVKRPEIALSVNCKDFKDLVKTLSAYFNVKQPKIKKLNKLEWDAINSADTYCYYDVDYVKFDLNDPNTGEHTLEIINVDDKNKYPVFRIKTCYIDGILGKRAHYIIYGESGYSFGMNNEYKYGDSFYKWMPRGFKDWIYFNQNPG